MYGIPQPNTYGQYGFGAYAGFPNQPAGGANPASPGMQQAAAGAVGTGLGASQPGATDGSVGPGAAAQGGQAQWPTGDPSSYYSNYWGGKVFEDLVDSADDYD